MTSSDLPVLLALDVDGTLLDGQGHLTPKRAAAITAVSRQIRTVFATGKTWPSIVDLVRRFGLDGPHIICNGAATAMSTGEIEVLDALPAAVSSLVIQELRRRDIAFAVYRADGSILADTYRPEFDRITDLGEAHPEYGPIAADGQGASNGNGTAAMAVLKVLAVLEEQEESDLRELCADRAHIQRTGPHFLEWNNPHASKGAALTHLSREHGWPLADMVAVGDSENDASMFRVAGTGVAVASASAAALAAADVHLTEDVAAFLEALLRPVEAAG
ncbi:HAD-IIB family hydrolase [Euzebya tangerina]|uniref:HAD-IIB family hydrolase n=1 Tax=Euzebya tangerina TaxID=591198 RepID=UPI000E31A5F3|nr:HAD family hydrolase [Euzebya tangerina]